MNVLGLSFDYHDSAAALICDGKIVAASEEERFSRRKHDQRFPHRAIDFCMKSGGIHASEVDAVAFYERTLLKFDRVIYSGLKGIISGQNPQYIQNTLDAWLRNSKFDSSQRIKDRLGITKQQLHCYPHHVSHAAAAFFCSPFAEATVVTMDGVGEYETLTVSVAHGLKIQPLYAASLPNSLGLFYSAFTAFLGFEVNEGEYKVMGMAGFGRPLYLREMREILKTTANGLFEIDQSFFEFECPAELPYSDLLIAKFGPPRDPESEFRLQREPTTLVAGSIEATSMHYANIAASLQVRVEEVILHIVSHAIERTGIRNVCIAGGVGLNSLANARVQREISCAMYVQPAAGDAGGALGAALNCYHQLGGDRLVGGLRNVYLGQEYEPQQILRELQRHGISDYKLFDNQSLLIDQVVDRLMSGKVIGWMQGRFEWGPRSLGNRSILATPTRADMQDIVNTKIKYRESFRPFAPSVIAERANEFFEITKEILSTDPENFMLAVAQVKENKKSVIPAVTHADGSARVQLVRRETNNLFYCLIEEFGRRSGIPILLNTSFNLRGEAMVNSPYDALETFYFSEMDTLVIGPFVIDKQK